MATTKDSNINLIAFYLPQYHEIPENNCWWGDGFTDWVNVKKARPLFSGHIQPRKPHDDIGYYNPLDIQVLEKQAEIAKKYGIFGFCFFHYWFKGKKLLEKPFEGILKSKKPNLPFCLCWANEPWGRTWDGRNNEILQNQEYGEEEDWIEHFKYILPALEDERAIKIDGKPIFLIYRVGHIKQANQMIDLWKREARKAGLEDIYIISMLTKHEDRDKNNDSNFDAVCEFFPLYHFRVKPSDFIRGFIKLGIYQRLMKKFIPFFDKSVVKIDYDYMWKRILSTKKVHGVQFRGAFVAWDNSPRKGESGIIIPNANPQKYQFWMEKQLARILKDPSESRLLFLNAWNEWAEGAYLEPDQTFGYGYLEATRKALENAMGFRTEK